MKILLVLSPLILVAATAPIGATICGAVAISRIRRSGGAMCGLPLAVADVLIFPLLLLDAIIFYSAALGFGLRHGTMQEQSIWAWSACLVCIVADFLIARWAWRAANRPVATSPASAAPASPAVPQPSFDYARQVVKAPAVGLIIAGAINLAVLAAVGAFSLISWNNALPRVQVQETARDSSYRELPDQPRPVAQVSVSRGMSRGVLLVAAATIPSIIIFIAAIRMLRLRGRGLAIAGSILALIAAPGSIIGLPFGIWALVVLNKREVMEAFAALRAQKVRSRAWVVILAVVGSLAVLAGAAGFVGVYLRDRMRAAEEDQLYLVKRSALDSDLQTINSQVQLYKIQHNDRLPGLRDGNFDGEWFKLQLTRRTNAAGQLGLGSASPHEYPYGPYLVSLPGNPFVNAPASTVVKGGPGSSPCDGTSGWWVRTTTGEVSPNHKTASPSGQASSRPRPLALRVRADGTMTIDGRAVTLEQWEKMAPEFLAKNPGAGAGIHADEGVKLEQLQRVVDVLRRNGVVTASIGYALPALEKERAAQSQPASGVSQTLLVNIRKDGALAVDGRELTLEQLQQKVEGMVRDSPDLDVTVRVDAEARHMHFARVLDVLRRAGVKSSRIKFSVSDRQ
ncbi:MAG: biopolymer transporter ExbD [Planctomycetaceae bacterium]|nr:biopolymer transporter ExbD [Planctomycetaceae bacterium]